MGFTVVQNRPALKILIPFVLGILIGYTMHIPVILMIIILSVIALVTIVIPCTTKIVLVFFDILMISGLFIAGTLRYELANDSLSQCDISAFADQDGIMALDCRVIRDPEVHPEYVNLVVAVDSVFSWQISPTLLSAQPSKGRSANDLPQTLYLRKTLPATGKVLISVRDIPNNYAYGDRLYIRGRLDLPQGQRNPGEFNYRKYLANQGIRAYMVVKHKPNIQLVSRGNGSWFLGKIVYPLRSYIITNVNRTLGGQEGALLKGLLVGARSEIDYELRDAFAKVGVIHVLAVSGLHVGFVVIAALVVLRIVRIPRMWRTIITIAILGLYIFLTNQKTPVIRASVMASVLLMGNASERKSDVFNSLALAAFVVLVINPLDLFTSSFQLSFAAVASILLLHKRFYILFNKILLRFQERGQRLYVYLITLFSVSLAAQLGTLPITVSYFNRIPVVSLLANLLVVPLVAVVVMLGYITTVCSVFWMGLAQIYANANFFLLNGLINIVHWGAQLPYSYIEQATPGLGFVSLYYCGLTLLAFWNHKWVRSRIIILILIICNTLIWLRALSPDSGMTAIFFDVGQGDAALFEFPNGRRMLVDTGQCEERFNAAERIITPYLKREGIHKIDVLLLTHPHSDHIGGAPYLLRNFYIGRIVDSMMITDSEIYQEILFIADSIGVPFRQVRTGDTLNIHPTIFVSILHPDTLFAGHVEQNLDQANDASIVMSLRYGRIAFLLTGDAEKQSEHAMLSRHTNLGADVLKVGHHGSSTSSTPSFIKAVNPDYAVVSVGKYNRFNLPSEITLRNLELHGAEVIRTDKNGAVVFWTDGEKLVRKR